MGNVSTKAGHKRLKEEAGISDLPQEKENAKDGDANIPSFDPSVYPDYQGQIFRGGNKALTKAQVGYHANTGYYENLSESSDDSSEHVSSSSDNKNKVNIWCEIGANKQDQDYQCGSDSSPSEGSGERRLQFKMDKEPKSAQAFQKNANSKMQENYVYKENIPGQYKL